jgi:NAD dependent epimerase/dehydratase
MKISGKKVLVTGADGFIGSHLVEELLIQGAQVRALVYYNSFNSYGWLDSLPAATLRQVEVVSGDIRDPFGVKTALQGYEVVFHLAALIGIPFSYHSPDLYIDTNIKGTLHVLQAARELGLCRVVHTSTSEVYGSAQCVPMSEEHPLQAQSPYAASKIGADQMALSFYRSFETPVAVIRPFNTFGPRQSARAVIPTIISQLAAGERQIKIGALHPTRDFTFVKDMARGFIAVAEADAACGEVVNIGSSFEISVGDTAKLIAQLMHRPLELVNEEVRQRPSKSEVTRLLADTSKAKRLTSWKPQYQGLEGFSRGLEETIRWFQDPQNLNRYKTGIFNV